MKSEVCTKHYDKVKKELAFTEAWDSVCYELEKWKEKTGTLLSIHISGTYLTVQIAGEPLETSYELCGLMKGLVEKHFFDVGFVKWVREDWPSYQSIDFVTNLPNDESIRIVSYPSDCEFVEAGTVTKKVYKVRCGGDE